MHTSGISCRLTKLYPVRSSLCLIFLATVDRITMKHDHLIRRHGHPDGPAGRSASRVPVIATGLAALGTSPALLGDAWPYRRGGQDAREFYPSTNRRFVKPPPEHESSVCARQQPKIGTDVPVQFRMVRRVVCTRCYPTW